MKLRLQQFTVFCLSVICVSTQVRAQEKTVPDRSRAKTTEAESRTFRKQQLVMLRENLFSRTLDSTKKMDEVALRVSARIQILSYLWESKILSGKHLSIKKNLALDAIADIDNNHLEMPRFMLDYLSSDLAALLEKYQPDLKEKLQAAKETAKNGTPAMDIRSLFELKNGDALAAAKIRQLLAQGDDVKGLNFWLDELRRQNSREFEPLLSEVIAIAKGGPQISFETLFWLNPICFQPEVPRPMRQSFAVMILSRTQPVNFVVTPAPQMAYQLLNVALPYIQQLLPELYEQALSQSLVLRTAINQTQSVSEERSKRLKESQSPIEDLVQEAETAKTKHERNELLAEAAEMALRREQFSLSLDIVAKLDLEVAIPGQTGFWPHWSGQFLKKLVKNATAANEVEIAEKAMLGMTSSLSKVQAIACIMRHWSEAGNKGTAHRLLIEAIKVAEAISDDFEKATAFLQLSITCDEVDESKKAQLLLSSVKALNSLNKPTTPPDQAPYQEYVRNLDNTAYQVIRGFKDLTTKDENAAISLVDQVNKSDLRTFALIGILSGLNDLLAKAQ